MSHPKVIVLGGAGMLGHKLFQHLRLEFPGTVAFTRRDTKRHPLDRVTLLHGPDVITGLDATAFDGARSQIEALRPDVIVNCVGVIKQRDESKNALASIAVNALFPHQLAELAATCGGRVIHFSTDCVFSGRRGSYTEGDQSDAEDLYGRTKYLGETASPNAITLRTSIIGRELSERSSLLEWFLAQNGKSTPGFKRVIYSGITTNEMANVVTQVITSFPTLTGLFQVVSVPISKFDLLTLVRDAYRLDIDIVPNESEVSDRSMEGRKFYEATGWQAPSWPEMIAALAADPTPYNQWKLPNP